MTTSLARYHARAPRYILNADDNNLVRLSGAERLPWEESTEIRDISLTGLSFTAPMDLSPQLGEIIKIQFSVPGAEQMACYAVVIRVQNIYDFKNLIAVHFYKLDRLQRLNLVQGLANRIQKQNLEDSRNQAKPINFGALGKAFALMALFLVALAWISWMRIFLNWPF